MKTVLDYYTCITDETSAWSSMPFNPKNLWPTTVVRNIIPGMSKMNSVSDSKQKKCTSSTLIKTNKVSYDKWTLWQLDTWKKKINRKWRPIAIMEPNPFGIRGTFLRTFFWSRNVPRNVLLVPKRNWTLSNCHNEKIITFCCEKCFLDLVIQ